MHFLVLFLALLTGSARLPELTEEEAVSLATEVLSDEKDLRAEDIVLRRAVAVEWPDASLGCPKRGETYAQVVTPGYRVLLSANDAVYRVHVGDGNAVVCGGGLKTSGLRPIPGETQQAEPESPIPEPNDPTVGRLVTSAREDLAKRLQVDAKDIQLLEARDVVWPDTSLGCPQPGMVYPQILRDGALVRLRVGKRTYAYHSGGGREPSLCERPPEK